MHCTKEDYPILEKGNIPMISEKYACEKIIELIKKKSRIRETQMGRRSSPGVQAKLNQIEIELHKTFPLWTEDAEQAMKHQEDINFLQSMKTDRIVSFGVFDQALASQIQRRESRQQRQKEFQEKAEIENWLI